MSPHCSDILKVEQMLSPVHYLTLKATSQYVRLCASKAANMEQDLQLVPPAARRQVMRQFGDPKMLRSDAARAAISNVLKIECIASECHGCVSITAHDPVYEATIIMFHASHDLMECPPSKWPKDSKKMVERYVPLMKIMFGETDQDVKKVEEKILGTRGDGIAQVGESFERSLMVSEGGISMAGSIDPTSKEQPSETKKKGKAKGKKKGGGSTKKKKKKNRK